jgi:hypothetical protein
MDKYMRIEDNYHEWLINTHYSKAFKAICILVRLSFDKCPGYRTKRLCEAAGILPNNFKQQFDSHIQYGTLKKINGLWYINPGHIFCGSAAAEAYYQECFNSGNLSEPTLEDLKLKEERRKSREALTKSNKDKLIKELQEEILLLKQQNEERSVKSTCNTTTDILKNILR